MHFCFYFPSYFIPLNHNKLNKTDENFRFAYCVYVNIIIWNTCSMSHVAALAFYIVFYIFIFFTENSIQSWMHCAAHRVVGNFSQKFFIQRLLIKNANGKAQKLFNEMANGGRLNQFYYYLWHVRRLLSIVAAATLWLELGSESSQFIIACHESAFLWQLPRLSMLELLLVFLSRLLISLCPSHSLSLTLSLSFGPLWNVQTPGDRDELWDVTAGFLFALSSVCPRAESFGHLITCFFFLSLFFFWSCAW